jgi:hypothetical protein
MGCIMISVGRSWVEAVWTTGSLCGHYSEGSAQSQTIHWCSSPTCRRCHTVKSAHSDYFTLLFCWLAIYCFLLLAFLLLWSQWRNYKFWAPRQIYTQIHSWINLRIATVGSVCLFVCDVRESRPEFWTEYLRVGRIICSIHPVIRRTKPDKQIPPASFPFPVPNVEG